MSGIARKVCMVGAFAVGKTSLVSRFVRRSFSDRYLTTVGVRVDTREVEFAPGQRLKLVLWDIAGKDEFSPLDLSYLRGAAAYLLVVDGTRASTLDTARELRLDIIERHGDLPFVLLVNKSDLDQDWELSHTELDALRADGWPLVLTSAKTGDGVEAAFSQLARQVR